MGSSRARRPSGLSLTARIRRRRCAPQCRGVGSGSEPKTMAKRPDHDAQWPWFVEWSLWTLGSRRVRRVRPSQPGSTAGIGPHAGAETSAQDPARAAEAGRALDTAAEAGRTGAPHREVAAARPSTGLEGACGPLCGRPAALPAHRRRGAADRRALPRDRVERGARSRARDCADGARDGEPEVALAAAALPEHGGIGVTSNEMDPDDVPRFRVLKAAVTGHVGRLLAYAPPRGGERDPAQADREGARRAPARRRQARHRPVASRAHGHLGHRPDYATSIVRVAKEILNA